jgi:NAD(P)-dependent dehydrogenase (short-subunit alcohol dehydrogenase family)
MRLDGAVAIVTGGASGLGAATVDAVAAAGGVPHVLDLRDGADGVAGERVDLADPVAAAVAVDRAAERHGRIDAVVTAAGTDSCGPLAGVDPRAWERVIMVNLVGTAAVVRAALGQLERNEGRVVTIGSTLGQTALGDATAYCASKFGIVGFTRSLTAELAGRVGVTMIVPGGMDTAFFDGRDEQYKPPSDANLNDPGNVAAAVVFALAQPAGCEVRELVVTPSTEPSWPP